MNEPLLKDFDLGVVTRPPNKEVIRCVVRLTTSLWGDSKGLHIKRDLNFLKKKCQGFNILEEDVGMVGASEVVDRITNLNECEDGIYQVITCNEWAAWETPNIIEDYDYKLIPYNEPAETKS